MMDTHDRYSDDSEGTDPHDPHFPPVDDRDLTRQRSPSPSSGTNSLTRDDHHGHHNQHHRRDRDRHTEVLKMLMNEEQAQSRSTRKFLRTALARLDNETLRAQKAENHALEIAQRFKVISDAHRQLQGELARVNEELRLYKVEYSNAQRELDRGRDIVKVLEAQRDEAEARAAKDRTTARKLKEEQLMLRAREEGRKAGYAEGLRRGLEQARFERLRSDGEEGTLSGPEPDSAFPDSQSDPLDDLGVRNLTSPPANELNIESPVPQHIIPPLAAPPAGEQGSRFHEHGIGATPAPDTASLASTTRAWTGGRPVSVLNAPPFPQHPDTAIPPDGWIPQSDDGVIRMPPPHELQRPHSPRSPSQPLPPLRPPSVAMDRGGQPNGTDYAYNRRNSAGSVPSIPSTTISQFDLVSAPGDPPRPPYDGNGHNRKSSLSVIHEVSSSMEFSPATDSRNMPEPITFPTASAEHRAAADQFPGPQTRSRQVSQRLADELRYEDPAAAQQWRQSAELRAATPKQSMPRRRPSQVTIPAPLSPASQARDLRPPSVASGRSGRQQTYRPHSAASRLSDVDSSVSGRRPPSSSQDWHIEVVPPSGPASTTFSPVVGGEELHMLSPNAVPADLPPVQPAAPSVPTVPNSPSMGRYPSMGVLPDVQPGAPPHILNLPPGFQPTGPVTPIASNAQLSPAGVVPSRSTTPSIYGPPPVQVPVQRSASSTSSRNEPPPAMHSRSRSLGGSSLGSAGDELRSKTPVVRPSSSASSANRPAYATAPTPAGVQYPAAPGGSMSPRSAASRLSGGHHQRSFSLNAGNTPAAPSNRPLSTAPPPKLRRVPSDASMDSAVSGLSRHSQFDHYRPAEYVDPAFLASSEDLTSANGNGSGNRKSVGYGHPSTRPASRNSEALSYASAQR